MIGNATRRHRTAPWLALGFLLCAAPAGAGVVTTLADSGAGSLREQVNAGGAVTFAAGLTGTINLTSAQISITGFTPSITGPGANAITINAGSARRIFSVGSGTTTLSGLTLTAGASGQGGAIFNQGDLTLNAVAITSSAATDAGGAIYNTGSLTVTSSLLTGNSVTASDCAGGGAIRSEGPGSVLVVTNSTITGNSAAACNGGGISNCTANCTAYYDGEVQPTVTLTATPNANQLFSGWSGACPGSANPVTTVTMTSARTCIATFVPNTFTVTSSVSGGNGSITPSGSQVVNGGTNVVFTLSPAPNYHVANVDGTCGGTLSGPGNTTYTTNAVSADCTVVAHFSIDQHVVLASVAGGNGSINPLGAVNVDHGSSTAFTLSPSANYHVASVDGT